MADRKSATKMRARESHGGRRVTLFLSDEPVERKVPSRDGSATFYYSKSNELVRADLKTEPVREKPYAGPMFMSLRNAAERLGAHPSTVRRAALKGTLRALPIGSQWVTTPEWLDEYKRKRRKPGRPRKTA